MNTNTENATTPPAGESAPPEPTGGEQQGFTPPASQDELNRIIADRLARERAKFADYGDLKAKADQLQALEDAQKTEAQKAADALSAAQAELAVYKQREQVAKWADEIVKGTHIPASALRGSSEEELRTHFEELKTLIPAAPAPPAAAGVAGFGAEPTSQQANIPLKDRIAAAEQAGDFKLSAELKAIQLGQL